MTHLWGRAESRPDEERVGITPEGVRDLVRLGYKVTVEESRSASFGPRPTPGPTRRSRAKGVGGSRPATRSSSAWRSCRRTVLDAHGDENVRVAEWLIEIGAIAQHMARVDHLARTKA